MAFNKTYKSFGMCYTPFYHSWSGMRQRCGNKNHPKYKDYGARGIKVATRWLKFNEFYKDMYPSYREGLSIERIDNNGDYCKENCRWATPREQAHNTRRNRYLEYNGEMRTMTSWSEKLKINRLTLKHRLDKLGLSVTEAFNYGGRF